MRSSTRYSEGSQFPVKAATDSLASGSGDYLQNVREKATQEPKCWEAFFFIAYHV
jgi:hypothetical protein